jgi:HlyD family secretion protein
VRAAERDVTNAETTLARAQADLDRLTKGPDPFVVRAAERELEQARSNLTAARSGSGFAWYGNSVADAPGSMSPAQPAAASNEGARPTTTTLQIAAQREGPAARETAVAIQTAVVRDSTPASETAAEREATAAREAASAREAAAAREAAMVTARLAVQAAEDRLAKLHEPPAPAAVDTARRAVDDATWSLSTARERLEATRRGSDQLTLAGAATDVDKARLGVDQAEAQLAKLQAGPPQPENAQPSGAVERARIAVANAEIQLEAARKRAAQTSPEAPGDSARAYDQLLIRHGLDQERAGLNALEQELASTTLRAPFSGVVGSVLVQAGDKVESGRTAVVLTSPGDPILQVNVLAADVNRVGPGQRVAVQLDGETTQLTGSVLGVGRSANGTGGVAQIQVSWSAPRPVLGATGRAEIILQEKTDALLVPRRALRTGGGRYYVEYLAGDTREIAEVTVGLSAQNNAEVVDGLQEGQAVWIGL